MQAETRQRWQMLREEAANEQDDERLIEVIQEINQLQEEKEAPLQQKRGEGKSAA